MFVKFIIQAILMVSEKTSLKYVSFKMIYDTNLST